MRKSRYLLLFISLLVLAALPDTAFAATNAVHSITTAFSSAASGWYTQVKKVAEELFAALFSIEIVWMVVQWLVTGKDVHEIFTSFVRKLLTIGFFLLILLNGHMLSWDVIQAFEATGVAAAGQPHTGMGWILNTGLHIFDACVKGPKSTSHGGRMLWGLLPSVNSTIANIMGAMVGIIVGLIAVFSLIYMALEYLAVQIEAILVASLGVILLGFGGSRFTASYVEGYIKYAVSVGIRFFVLVVWVAFIELKAPTIIANLIAGVEHKAGGTIPSMMVAYGDVLIFVILIAWLTKKLPSIASSILTGGSSLSGGELAGGIMKGVALATAAVATGGAVAAGVAGAAGASGAAASLSEATGAAGSEGVGSLGGSAGGSAANGASGASQGVPAPRTPTGGGASGGTGNAQGVPAPSSSARTSGSASTSTLTQSGTASAPAPASGSRTSESPASSEPSGAQAPEPAKGTEDGTQVRTSAPSETQAGVDHRASAPNESPSSGGGSGTGAQAPASGGQSAPVPAPASRGQSAPTPAPAPASAPDPVNQKLDKLIKQTAPKDPSFLDRAGQHEKKMQQVMDHISPGEPSTGSVSAPGINVKHLSD